MQVNINIPRKSNRERSKSPAAAAVKAGTPAVLPPPSAAAMAAGILPPGTTSNPFGSQAAPKLNVRYDHKQQILCNVLHT